MGKMAKTVVLLLLLVFFLGLINFYHRTLFQEGVIHHHDAHEQALREELYERTEDRFTGTQGKEMEASINEKIDLLRDCINGLRDCKD